MSSCVLGRYQDDLMRRFLTEQVAPATIPEKAKLFRGLADPTRLEILEMLAHGAMSTVEVAQATDDTVVGAAAHLACLEACGLVRRIAWHGKRRYEARSTVGRLVRAANAVLTGAGAGVRNGARYSG